MQTILLQDDPDLFRGLEHSLLCREGINLLTATGEAPLLDACRTSLAQVVLLAAAGSSEDLVRRIESLPHAPLCFTARDGQEASLLLTEIQERLGLPGRDGARHPCRVPVLVRSGSGSCRGRTRDLSTSGVFVATEPGCGLCGAVEIDLRPPGASEVIRCRGRVVRGVPLDRASDRLAGLAVSFTAGHGLSTSQVDRLVMVEKTVSR